MPVEVNGVRELILDLKTLPDDVKTDVINRMSQIAFDSAQKGAGRHVVTGALFQSVFNKPITGGRQVGHDTLRAPQAFYVIQGWERKNPIYPKKKKALRWVVGNKFVFAKVVERPAKYEGDPYMDKAADDALAQFAKIVDESLARHI